MTLDEIIAQIADHLPSEDMAALAYLNEQAEQYSDHEFAAEITRACARMMMDYIPADEQAQAFDDMLEEIVYPILDGLAEAQNLVHAGADEEALSVLEALIGRLDAIIDQGLFQNDATTEYYCFGEPFEELLFMYMNRPEHQVEPCMVPFMEVYDLYGKLLLAQGQARAAAHVLKQAARWNPCDATVLCDYADALAEMGDEDGFLSTVKEAFKVAYSGEGLARCYCTIGRYFMNQNMDNEALGCTLLGLQYDEDNPAIHAQITAIQEKTDGTAQAPTFEDMMALCDRYGFNIGADDLVVGIACHYGETFFQKGDGEQAEYFLEIAYELTEDDTVKSMLDQIQ